MKKCLNCGYNCENNDDVCPICGTKFSSYDVSDYIDQHFNTGFNGSKQQSSSVSGSTVESSTNNNTQRPSSSNTVPQNAGDKLFNSLWIIFSFIPFINGFGIFFAGKKTSKKSWICEGLLYEVPVIFHLVFGPSLFTLSLVFLSLILSIVRSVMIINSYKIILNKGNYKKLNRNFMSLLMFISSFIPFLNGIGFIHFGNKYSKLYLIVGYLFELVWILLILSLSFLSFTLYSIGLFIGVGIASLILSGMAMISFNFDCNEFYHYVNDPRLKVDGNTKRLDKEMFKHYESQLNDVKIVFDDKEKKVTSLIKEHFGLGNLTSNRFLAVVDNSHKNVYNLYNSGIDLINYTSKQSQQVEKELIERINNINSINEEMEKLTVELILNIHEDENSDENIKNLVKDMENLINDINKYE